jgi:hypothetical protein
LIVGIVIRIIPVIVVQVSPPRIVDAHPYHTILRIILFGPFNTLFPVSFAVTAGRREINVIGSLPGFIHSGAAAEHSYRNHCE